MQNPRLPKTVFVVLAAFAAIYFLAYYPQLPPVVASHFDALGRPNSWQTKSQFFAIFVVVTLLSFLLVFGVPRLIKILPVQFVNLPNKKYWLGPEQLESSLAYFSTWFAWFGCAVFLVILFTFDYAVQSNLHPDHRPDPARMWYILVGFMAFTLVWTFRLVLRFAKVPNGNRLA
jgi:uncharacterized membrane protein